MSWMPVFAVYAMPALLLFTLSMLTQLRGEGGRRLAHASVLRSKAVHGRKSRHPSMSGDNE